MSQHLYPIYQVEVSDKGFYFKKSKTGEELYITTKGRPKSNDWVAKSVLALGNGELYVVHWEHSTGETGTWFLNKQLTLITNKNLLLSSKHHYTCHEQLWASYLHDILYRIWYTLITPDFIHTHPNFSPSELTISDHIQEDVKLVLNSIVGNCELFNAVTDDLTNFSPSITKQYIINGLTLHSSYASNWQDHAIEHGYIEIPSPFSGKLIKSYDSLLLSPDAFTTGYLFYDQGECFILITTKHSSHKYGYYFIKKNLFVYCNRVFFNTSVLTKFLFSIFFDWKIIKLYLLSGKNKKRKIVTTGRETHIGHHLWNELSGLQRIEDKNLFNKVAGHYVTIGNSGEHFGKLDLLFPKLSQKINRVNMQDAARAIYESNCLHIRPGDTFIPLKLVDKIIGYANYPSSFSNELEVFDKKTFSVIILFTLRIGDRCWIEQEKGICEVIDRLLKHYNVKISLILDGHNSSDSGEKLKSHGAHLIKKHIGIDLFEEEYQMAERIKNSLASDKIQIINTIGCSVQESIRWCLLSDFFVAPWGAGLAKYKWVTNSPGLVFSSQQALATNPDLHIYDDTRFREGATPCEYLDLSAIEDVDEESIVGKYRKSFKLSIDVLYDKMKAMCEKYGRVSKSTEISSSI